MRPRRNGFKGTKEGKRTMKAKEGTKNVKLMGFHSLGLRQMAIN